MEPSRHVHLRIVGPTLVAKIEGVESLYDHAVIQEIGDVLYGLIKGPSAHRLVVDLSALSFAATEMIAKLVSLNRRCKESGIELVLCGLGPVLSDSLANLKIIELFRVAATEAEALGPPPPSSMDATQEIERIAPP